MRFDVVVVGAGAAGCVVASRLADQTSRSVLLVEAGPDLRSSLPEAFRDGWDFPREHEWGFSSEPHSGNDVLNLRRGKLVGGTGWVTRFAVRGSPRDFDRWAELGNVGWSFDEVLPYFNAIESDLDFGADPWHGDAGPIPVNRYLEEDVTDVLDVAMQAATEIGFPAVADHNRPDAMGVGRMPMSSREGRRVTTADAYLRDASNLTLRSGAQIARVLFEGLQVRGVELTDGTEIESPSVVLCAGVYGTPTILMRSGVGPPDHLGSTGIDVVAELPGVGSNLADHPQIEIEMGYSGDPREVPSLHSIATFHSEDLDSEGPDLMLWFSDPLNDPQVFTIEVVLLKPHCRGSVRLRSEDPTESPRITLPRVDESDVKALAVGYRRAVELATHPRVRGFCDQPEVHTDDRFTDFVRSTSYSIPHVVGTCAMGPSPDDGAVVDSMGRVHGIDGLIVVDASVIPEPPSGFPHLPTIMIAERLSEWLTSQL